MKKSIMICALVMLPAAFSSTARATLDNPVNWHWSLQTDGARDDWYSPASLDTDYPEYNYEGGLTHIEGSNPWPALELEVAAGNYIWVDIWDDIPAAERSGSDTWQGQEIPFVDKLILHIEHPEITADFLASADKNGNITISIDNITFGQVDVGGTFYDVTGARFQADVTITGVPEPSTLVLLGLGGLLAVKRGGKNRYYK